ncbi:MAG TPA: serine hydrolase [Kofleriaceae bacterium]|nr:serine hydrolase [Kofleriaceae bacterium]
MGAVGYTRFRTPELVPNLDTLPYRGTSAGGGWSTTGDLLRFANALVGHVLLDASHTELVTTGKVDTGHGFTYAYGFGDMQIDGVRCIGHNGGFPGVNGELLVCENGYTIAMLANLDPPAASRIAQFIATRLPQNDRCAVSRCGAGVFRRLIAPSPKIAIIPAVKSPARTTYAAEGFRSPFYALCACAGR